VPTAEFELPDADGTLRAALELLSEGTYFRDAVDDLENCEYFVAVEWAHTVPLTQAFNEVGLFGNQNSVCAPKTPKWRHIFDRLEQYFTQFDTVR